MIDMWTDPRTEESVAQDRVERPAQPVSPRRWAEAHRSRSMRLLRRHILISFHRYVKQG